jgi:pyruvate, orthophosphate dikinase
VKYVYDFAEGSADQRELLGGKGANLAEMTHVLGEDRVPAGFTITTEACVAYMREGSEPEGLEEQVTEAVSRLEDRVGKKLGDSDDPLLVSVRSGARESMPGMLDTVLNLGLNAQSVEGLARATDNERFAWDSFRRFVQMFGNVVRGIAGERYEAEIKRVKGEHGVKLDTELDVDALRGLTERFQEIYREETGDDFPHDPTEQLRLAIRAVFDSWTGDRAVHYRRINRIPDEWGTAVNVQQMVFGNQGDTSGSGVAFSRDEVTGEATPSGDFLVNAQGEDVVSGVRNTKEIDELADVMPEVHAQLMEILRTLEAHYKDMQDTEFTVEDGSLYLLQTRSAKRPAQAAVRFAVDAVEEGLLTREEALLTIEADSLDALLHPTFDPEVDYGVLARGVAASPGAAKGHIVFTADEAVAADQDKRDVILVRPFTEADDVAGFHAARGILTSEGGKASHAALVARGMGRPCVCGASELEIDLGAETVSVNGTTLNAGDKIAINGTTGDVTVDDVPLIKPQMSDAFRTVLGWADELRELGVRANADTPEAAEDARRFGAEGIGLCRTEHIFLGEHQPTMEALILADTDERREASLGDFRRLQQEHFEGIFEAMGDLPVTIRLLDPPLHEFLPGVHEVMEQVERARIEQSDDLDELERKLTRVRRLEEANPMLGTRGVRVGILEPDIYRAQVEAVMDAAREVRERTGTRPKVEVMIPLVDYERELELMRKLVIEVGDAAGVTAGEDYTVGTMIELPRACTLADHIAEHADFFSFGTNDLTQTTLGFSRDDIEKRILGRYIDMKILDRSPFETLDEPGVGQLVRMGAWLGRQAKPDLKLGICGEHGGDPDSIEFFASSGLDYVSCSPFRVPVARVAAAQAAVRGG